MNTEALNEAVKAAQEFMTVDTAKPLDDPKLQRLFSDVICGAISLGLQGRNKPPEGHWLMQWWLEGRNQANIENATKPGWAVTVAYDRVSDGSQWSKALSEWPGELEQMP